jgi:hypothetical protein
LDIGKKRKINNINLILKNCLSKIINKKIIRKILLIVLNREQFLSHLDYHMDNLGFNNRHNQSRNFAVASYETQRLNSHSKYSLNPMNYGLKFSKHWKNAHGLDIARSFLELN